MKRRCTIFAFVLLSSALLVGCSQWAQDSMRAEKAKVDFLAHQGNTGFDATSEESGLTPPMKVPRLREFTDCSVRKTRMFEQLSISPEIEFWAVELEFSGTDTETGKQEDGTAILLYRAFRQVGEEEKLIGIFPGTTDDEIRMIREGTRAAFEFLRQGTG